jgi:hypothetical protein
MEDEMSGFELSGFEPAKKGKMSSLWLLGRGFEKSSLRFHDSRLPTMQDRFPDWVHRT